MEKINFVNNTTPALNATNLNKLQQNVEDAINERGKYSGTEITIGTWLDGKPVYKKVITAVTASEETQIDISYLNIKKIINISGTIGPDYDTKSLPFILEDSGTIYYASARYSNGTIYISNSSAYNNLPLWIILEFTKTTD